MELEAKMSRRGNKGISHKEKGKKPVKAKVVKDDLQKSLAPCSKRLVRDSLIDFEKDGRTFLFERDLRIIWPASQTKIGLILMPRRPGSN